MKTKNQKNTIKGKPMTKLRVNSFAISLDAMAPDLTKTSITHSARAASHYPSGYSQLAHFERCMEKTAARRALTMTSLRAALPTAEPILSGATCSDPSEGPGSTRTGKAVGQQPSLLFFLARLIASSFLLWGYTGDNGSDVGCHVTDLVVS